jgi:hypothetical protein
MIRYLLLFDSYGLVSMGRPLWREDGCLLYMLLVLASTAILGSESLGTRDHILLSQIWDFPFRSLIRLAGSQWRYSTPPPHGLSPTKSKSHCDWRSVSQSVSQSVSLGVHSYDFFMWGALSNEKKSLSFIHAAGPCQWSQATPFLLLLGADDIESTASSTVA